MKTALPYLIVSAVTTLSTIVVVVLLLTLAPERFFPPAETTGGDTAGLDSTDVVADSSSVQLSEAHRASDSSASLAHKPVAALPAHTVSPDTTKALVTNRPPGSSIAVQDSARLKLRRSMAKVLEAMEPGRAAKILRDLPDEDVRDMILALNKRQAAKILASFEPEHAARIVR